MLVPATTALTILVTLLAYFASRSFLGRTSSPAAALLHTMVNATKPPAYFISHGGPPSKQRLVALPTSLHSTIANDMLFLDSLCITHSHVRAHPSCLSALARMG